MFVIVVYSETFSFVLTGEDGSRWFCYCRKILVSADGGDRDRKPNLCLVFLLFAFMFNSLAKHFLNGSSDVSGSSKPLRLFERCCVWLKSLRSVYNERGVFFTLWYVQGCCGFCASTARGLCSQSG